jgi:hypothetical protein
MSRAQSVNIRSISRNRAEQVGYYRFLENENVKVSELVKTASEQCQGQVQGLHGLALSDSSEINLQQHANHLNPDEIGVVGNNRDLGFFIHPTLVIDSDSGFPLGLSAIQLWHRPPKRANKHQRQYPKLPIEEKESYKWLRSAADSQPVLEAGGATCVTYVGDRESDIYEEWVRVPTAHSHLLVRACRDRRLQGSSQRLYETLSQQPCQGTEQIEVRAEPRTGRGSRTAELEIRLTPVSICRPRKVNAQEYPDTVSLDAVEAKEVNPPAGETPIHWRLLTTHEVTTLEQALQVIQWYRWRWRIEELFAILKGVGLDLESTRLESVKAIECLSIVALMVALRTLQMKEGREDESLPATLAFSASQQQCLQQLGSQLEGRTQKQQNPFAPGSLPWAGWVIARLGGWSGYRSQSPPGIRTLSQGLRKFEAIFEGWSLAQDALVCT